MSIETTKIMNLADGKVLYDDLRGRVDAKYTKPGTGIPATDLADGVIPVLTTLIDDTAGDGDTNVTWSADKSHDEIDAVVVASETQPQQAGNKLWIEEDAEEEYSIPTTAEMTTGLAAKVNKPSSEGTSGQVLRTNGNGSTYWDDDANATDIANAVTDWLDTNVPTGTTVVVDSSLTVSGAAADSKKTGDEISELKSAVNNVSNKLGGYDLYNAIDDNLTNHSGLSGMKFCLDVVLPANHRANIKIKVYADCTYTIYLVSTDTNKIIGIETFSLEAGENEIALANSYSEDAYIAITAEADTILYKVGGDHDVRYTSSTSNWVIGTTITVPSGSSGSSSFAIKITVSDAINDILDDISSIKSDINDVESDVDDLSNNIESLSEATGNEVLYNAVEDTLTTHTGVENNKYCLNLILPRGKVAIVSIKVYASCSFTFYYVSQTTNKVLGKETFDLNAGLNSILTENRYNVNAYIAITGSADTIYYNVSGSHQIEYVSTTANYNTGDTVTVPTSSSSKASFSLSIIATDNINGKIDDLKEDIEDIQDDIEDLNDDFASITGGSYSSMAFEYNSSAGSISSFMLLQPAPQDGLITKIKCKQGATKSNVGVAVYEWSDKTDLDTITLKHEERVIFIDSIADVAIKIKKGQYIGINYNVSATCAWYNGASGAGFVYLPTQSGATLYENKYITLSYEMVYDSVTDLTITSPLKNKTIFLAGDSRSSDDYSFYKTTLTKKTGANVIVGGASGKVASYIASNTYFADVIANPHDFSIWIVGGNDVGRSGDVGTFSATSPNGIAGEDVVTETDITQDYAGTKFIQAIDHIIRKYRALYYDFKTQNDGHKYRMIMCTDLPQNRNNSSDAYSQKANWERKVNAIIEACQKNNIPCLDLYHMCAFDMSQEPYWTSPTDKFTDNGIYFMDGLHPNQYGIDIITSIEVEEMKKYVSINPYSAST